MSYRCAVCGEIHDDLPDIGADKPDHFWGIPEEERDQRIALTSDTCIIDNDHYFIRGVLEIPLHDYPKSFGFGVWVSQKKENFQTYLNNVNSGEIGPFFGWLCTRIAYYNQDTFLLKTMVHFRGNGLRPYIVLKPTDHPAAIDQRQGISLDTAWKIVHFYTDSSA